MELGCPLCNSLNSPEATCPSCGHQMENRGQLTDFAGPYSPYADTPAPALSNQENSGEYCMHLYHCPACNRDQRIPVPLNIF